VLRVGRIPIRATPFLPRDPAPAAAPEAAARTGYTELIQLLAARRSHRRVRLLVVGGAGRAAATRLEGDMAAIGRGLESMGIPHRRLSGANLRALAPDLRDPRPSAGSA
jgi:hypothetical protein